MGKTHINAVEIAQHGDSIAVYVIEDQMELALGKVRGVINIRTNKLGQVEVTIDGIKAQIVEN